MSEATAAPDLVETAIANNKWKRCGMCPQPKTPTWVSNAASGRSVYFCSQACRRDFNLALSGKAPDPWEPVTPNPLYDGAVQMATQAFGAAAVAALAVQLAALPAGSKVATTVPWPGSLRFQLGVPCTWWGAGAHITNAEGECRCGKKFAMLEVG